MKSTEEIINLLDSGFDFENFLNRHINGLFVVRADGRILSADKAGANLFGYRKEELKEAVLEELFPEFLLPESLSPDNNQGHAKGRHRNGDAIALSYNIRKGWQQEEEAFFLLLHQKSSITQSLELYTHMFEWMPVGILVYSLAQHRALKCNQELLEMFGAGEERQFLSQGPFSIQPEPRQPFGSLEKKLSGMPREERNEFEINALTVDGKKKCLEVATTLIPALNNTLILLLFKDITSGRRSALELRDSQRTLEAIISTAVDGIIIINERGIIQMANEATTRLFGYSANEIVGQNVRMLMPEPHHSQHDTYIDNYRKTGVEKIIGIGREVEGRRKNGQLFPFKLGVSRVEQEGRVLFAGVIHDLTEQKQAEAQILKLNKELEQKVEERTEKLTEVVNKLLQSNTKLEREIKERKAAEAALRQNEEELRKSLEREKELNELKSRFVSMASHEFRTPLTTIASSSELIGLYTEGQQQEKREKHLRRIKSAVANLTGILGDFLSLSKLEEGKIHMQPVPFNLHELAEEASDDMQSLLKPGQKIGTQFEKLDEEVVLDKKLLKNIFINLLSNAIKYSGEGSTVHFSMRLENGTIKGSIRDEGIGIPESDQKHLFSRFFRAANAVNIQGTGLGLNIVKRYLELLKGDISFKSSEGQGTTFFIKIPLPGREQ